MSSFKQCIINGFKEGLITAQQSEKLLKNLDEVTDFYQFRKGLSKPEAERAAAKKTYDELKIEEADKLRVGILQKSKIDEIMTLFATYRNKNGEIDYANAYRSLYAVDQNVPTPNIETQIINEMNKANKFMVNILDQMRYKLG